MGYQKYFRTFVVSWDAGFVYRLNFVMWRVRTVIQLLTIYFLWAAVLHNKPGVFGYTGPALLTYILLSSILRAFVFASRSSGLQEDISSGDLNNFLVKPINILGYWFSRDLADKTLNILFSVLEMLILLCLLRPPIMLPATREFGIAFIILMFLAIGLYFFFSLIISLSVFWMPEGSGWPQRFFVMVMLEFLAGGLFPLDILPSSIYQLVAHLPTAYMLSIPLQVYLGRIPAINLPYILLQMLVWLVILAGLALWLFKRGLKVYGAYGR